MATIRNVTPIATRGPSVDQAMQQQALAQALYQRSTVPNMPQVGGPVQAQYGAGNALVDLANTLASAWNVKRADNKVKKAQDAESEMRGNAIADYQRSAPVEQMGAASLENLRNAPEGQLPDPVMPRDEATANMSKAFGPQMQAQLASALVARDMAPKKGPEAYTLSPGQTRFEGGQQIASMPKEQSDAGFTLPAGGARYDASGKVIAERAPEAEKAKPGFVTLSPQEIAAAGLPPGTAAQKNTQTGQIDVLTKRDTTGSLSQKDANTAKLKLNTVQLARQQLNAIKSAFEEGKTGMNAFGPGQAMLPTQAGKLFDSRVDQMRSTLTALTRVPGVGAMSDYETKLDQGKFPARGDYESVTADKIAQLDNMLAVIENGYNGLLSGGATNEVAPTQSAAPQTNAKGWVLHTDASGNKAYVSPDGKQFEEAP